MASFLSRRRALIVLTCALALFGSSSAKAGDANKLVRVSIIPIYVVHSHFAAEQQGYFAEEGISVTTQPVQGGALGIPGLISGSFDVLYTNTVSVLAALERGIDIRIIAESTRVPATPPDAVALFKRKGEQIAAGKDLEGKNLAINQKFSFQWLAISKWIAKTGGDPAKVTFREIPFPSMLDALKSKQADAAFMLDPYLGLAAADPQLELAAWPNQLTLPGVSTSVWIVGGKWADANPDLVKGYTRAFYKGGAWVNENIGKQPYYELVAKFTKMDPAKIQSQYNNGQEMRLEAKPILDLAAVMKEFDMLKTDIDVESKIIRVK
jgi:NitT/TauT family transport system substrate-binding protein